MNDFITDTPKDIVYKYLSDNKFNAKDVLNSNGAMFLNLSKLLMGPTPILQLMKKTVEQLRNEGFLDDEYNLTKKEYLTQKLCIDYFN